MTDMEVKGNGTIEQMEKEKTRGKCRRWRLWLSTDEGRRSRTFHGTYSEARVALEAFRKGLADEVPEGETFAAYADAWARFRAGSGRYDPNTVAKDKRHVRALSRALEGVALTAVTPDVCRDALMRIQHGENASGRELTHTTMEGFYVALGLIMQQAEDDGLVSVNPMRKIKLPHRDTKEREALSPEELVLLLNRLDELPLDGRVMAVYLMACLGLRRGEACALMDADVSGGFARVVGSVKEANGRIGSTKTAAGTRTLPVPPRLQGKVDDWRVARWSLGYGDAETLACDSVGGVLRPQNLYRWWRKVSPGLGCEGLVLHELRHSNLSMVARHMSPYDLQRYAGWSSIAPAKVYIHDDLDSVTRGVMDAWSGTE